MSTERESDVGVGATAPTTRLLLLEEVTGAEATEQQEEEAGSGVGGGQKCCDTLSRLSQAIWRPSLFLWITYGFFGLSRRRAHHPYMYTLTIGY